MVANEVITELCSWGASDTSCMVHRATRNRQKINTDYEPQLLGALTIKSLKAIFTFLTPIPWVFSLNIFLSLII